VLTGGELEAAVRPHVTDDDAAELERDRLERDLAEAEGWLIAARERLANEAFMDRAPAAVVEGARAREAELAEQVARLRARIGEVGEAGENEEARG
jgi:valyl-tRNA synthetase